MLYFYELKKYFPQNIFEKLEEYFSKNDKKTYEDLEEIRLRTNRPLILKFNQIEATIDYIVEFEDILDTIQKICENSIYSYQNQICNGYITVQGGHRVGLTGNVVLEKNKIVNINYISSLNFRIAKQVLDCSKSLLNYVLDLENNTIFNTLIVSPPGVGKTTIVRDLIRKISTGIKEINFKGINVGLVDERGEIAAMYKGIAQNDVGIKTDVLDNIPKAIGMKMLIRSMTPQVICADEIGSQQDVEAINFAVCSGIKGVFTAHGVSLEDISLNPVLKNLLNTHIFERILFLNYKGPKGELSKKYSLNKKNLEYILME